MPELALALYVVFIVMAGGWRTWLQYRRTGDHGFRGLSGKPGSLAWWGGVLLVLGMLAAGAAPVLQIAGVLTPLLAVHDAPVNLAGLVLALGGLLVTLAAQLQMRASWRIGVDERETTPLVTAGLFRLVRNPIFSGVLLAVVGFLAMVPNAVSAMALAAVAAGLEIQVRCVEEPYLLRIHGESYRAYARTAGRFVPWIGTLR